MMKIFVSMLFLLLLLFGAAYGLLFTTPGNNFLQPLLEKKIAAQVPLPTRLETFLLRPDRFEFALKIGDDTIISTKGTMNLLSQHVDATYDVEIQELSNLQKLIGTKFNGPFRTHGSVKGDKERMQIDGESDIAESETAYHLTLKAFKPGDLKADVEHLHIERLLHMLDQPDYAQGIVNIKADIPSLDMENLDGKVLTTIRKGLLHPLPIERDFNLSIPSNFTFKGDIATDLEHTKAVSDLWFVTSVANLSAKRLAYDIKEGALSTDYTLNVPDLDKLHFITNQHMKGDIKITGDVETSKNLVQATAHSDTLGGAFDALYKNGIANVQIKNIQTVALTDMLLYPHIFDSRANAKLTFDTLKQIGTLHAELLNGQILPNKMSFLLQQLANFDITKEVYERTIIDTKIDKKILRSDLYMKSRLTEISSKDGKIDLENQTIDTTLDIKIRKMMLPVTLEGPLMKPNIKIDKNALLKSKAKEEIEKKLPESIKNSPAGDLIKSFF
ncbi:hypothetical protein [Hydrogenimonas cancrithermarum]|uniref:AsmA-like C-terminal domain-containing protein n=1 Tax=Hydrogenimonas cancrithermarum TaxID=2993563 RepID=A0ABM8FL38_9BACT|nr:hypothetical protein [Hydrogenimonas cancrithermarum]BDY12390.1 hypothetical protein HCR_07020 [Hydrogenimonas cancrithermarum]